VEQAAPGRDAVVDLRGGVEGELDAAAPEAAEDVANDVELEEAVQKDERHDDGGQRVALRGHHRRRAEQQLDGRLALGDGLRHPFANRYARLEAFGFCDLGAALRSVRKEDKMRPDARPGQRRAGHLAGAERRPVRWELWGSSRGYSEVRRSTRFTPWTDPEMQRALSWFAGRLRSCGLK